MTETACQHCGSHLVPGTRFSCSHGCTFCEHCAGRLNAVCPNCAGELRRDAPLVQ